MKSFEEFILYRELIQMLSYVGRRLVLDCRFPLEDQECDGQEALLTVLVALCGVSQPSSILSLLDGGPFLSQEGSGCLCACHSANMATSLTGRF